MTDHNHHESAATHVTGESVFINDMQVSEQLLVGRIVYSKYAHAKIKRIDYSKAIKLKGVHAVLSYKDIPGENQMGPVFHDEPCLAVKEVNFTGQAILLIAAETDEIAMDAEKLINIEYDILEPILTIEKAIEKNNLLAPSRKIERGEVNKTLKSAKHKISGTLRTGAQEHWYLETQTALCIPGEGNEMQVYSSTQHPSETQAIVAEVLGVQRNEVVVEIRRMGGAFGGKETQANHVAAWTALLARATNRPVKIHLFRDDDQKITGKRHRFLSNYKVGFDDKGIIHAVDIELNADAGSSADLSMAILERALFHADNAYYIPHFRVTGTAWKTNLPSNTAFRGFGGPQGMAVIETIVDRVARFLGEDAAEIRKRNFYGLTKNNVTPYDEKVENNPLPKMYEQILASSNYKKRKQKVAKFNAENKFYKKGIALTPVKFGISFTTAFLNQAGALVNIYTDGTVQVNHGGTEMGQGLYTKMRHIASTELGIGHDKIKVIATNTSKVPNTSATAASSGSDLNGMAVKNAIDQIKERLNEVAYDELSERFSRVKISKGKLVFENEKVFDPSKPKSFISFKDLINTAYLKQVSLSASGFYRTPNIHYDKVKGKGHPFHYYAFGMAVTEVMIDILTGRHKIIRTDILHDVGSSINESIDKGQIIGGFVQGLGWVTTEEIKWDAQGNLLTHSPDTYKIPTAHDIPEDLRVSLMQNVSNPNTIHNSKAVGEPPLMLAFSVWMAIKDAISAVDDHRTEPDFNLPATCEQILLSIERLRKF
jgi:xanthine dehydrogenase large subunit